MRLLQHNRGRQHDKQRRHAVIMVRTAQARVAVWICLLVAFAFSHAIRHLYASVAFVSLLSVGALLLTDWGQYAASSAELAAGDAHHDAEATRDALAIDVKQLDGDIARLAALHPGPAAEALAAEIRKRIGAEPGGKDDAEH